MSELNTNSSSRDDDLSNGYDMWSAVLDYQRACVLGMAVASPEDDLAEVITAIEVIAPAPSNVIVASFGRRTAPQPMPPLDAA